MSFSDSLYELIVQTSPTSHPTSAAHCEANRRKRRTLAPATIALNVDMACELAAPSPRWQMPIYHHDSVGFDQISAGEQFRECGPGDGPASCVPIRSIR